MVPNGKYRRALAGADTALIAEIKPAQIAVHSSEYQCALLAPMQFAAATLRNLAFVP